MKKTSTALLIVMILGTGIAHAQYFKKGSNVVSAGIGLGSSIGSYSYGTQTPALSLQYERGVWEMPGPGVISLGGYLGFKSFKNSGKAGAYSYDEKWNYKIIGIRSAYHYQGLKQKKLDVYGGVMLSYNILSYSYHDNTGNNNRLHGGSYGSAAGFTLYVGGRYFFSDNIAAFAELGYGVSYLNLGLAFTF